MSDSIKSFIKESDALLQPRLVNHEPLLLVGVRELMDMNSAQTIPQLWADYVPRIGTIAHAIMGTSYGVCIPGPSVREFYYMASNAVTEFGVIPEGMGPLILPSQCYAVFTHNGDVTQIRQTMDSIFDEWLPTANYEHVSQSLHFFERYGPGFDPFTGSGDIEIWLPVKAKN